MGLFDILDLGSGRYGNGEKGEKTMPEIITIGKEGFEVDWRVEHHRLGEASDEEREADGICWKCFGEPLIVVRGVRILSARHAATERVINEASPEFRAIRNRLQVREGNGREFCSFVCAEQEVLISA